MLNSQPRASGLAPPGPRQALELQGEPAGTWGHPGHCARCRSRAPDKTSKAEDGSCGESWEEGPKAAGGANLPPHCPLTDRRGSC